MPPGDKRLAPVTVPRDFTKTDLVWRVRKYIENKGASYAPQLSDFTTLLPDGIEIYLDDDIHDYAVTSYKGNLIDNHHEQYQHTLYTVRLATDQEVQLPIYFVWQQQINIVAVHDGTTTTVYTTDTEENKYSRTVVSLAYGITDLHIMTYTSSGGQQLVLNLDIASIHRSIAPVDRLVPRLDWGKVTVYNVTNPTFDDTHRVSVDVDYDVRDGLAWMECVDDGGSYATPCRNGEVQIQRSGGYIVPYDTGTQFGCWIQYRRVAGGAPLTIDICYNIMGYG